MQKVSMCQVSTKALSVPSVREYLHEAFCHELGGVSEYEWRFIPKGGFLFESSDLPILAERDYAIIYALA